MPTCRDLPAVLQRGDTSRPAITTYDRTGGATDGERIELSRRVLMTWAAKAAGALQDELLAEPGTTVGLALPPHWRAGYWALATWWVGATLVTGPEATAADVLVTHDPELAANHDGERVLVTLAGLARAFPGAVPTGAIDEARELPSFPDRFGGGGTPGPEDVAWRGGRILTHGDPVAPRDGRVVVALGDDDLDPALDAMAAAWAGEGSLVLVRGELSTADLDRLAAVEHAVPGMR